MVDSFTGKATVQKYVLTDLCGILFHAIIISTILKEKEESCEVC